MGALARALLLLLPPLLAPGLLRVATALAPAPFTLPLRVGAATGRGAAPTPGPGPPAEPRADGLAFALEPAGGAANFLAMVDNLQGDSGRGYYLEVLIGTPPQTVGRWVPVLPPPRAPGCSHVLVGGSWETPAVPLRGLASPPKQIREDAKGLRRPGRHADSGSPIGARLGGAGTCFGTCWLPSGAAGRREETCNLPPRGFPCGGRHLRPARRRWVGLGGDVLISRESTMRPSPGPARLVSLLGRLGASEGVDPGRGFGAPLKAALSVGASCRETEPRSLRAAVLPPVGLSAPSWLVPLPSPAARGKCPRAGARACVSPRAK